MKKMILFFEMVFCWATAFGQQPNIAPLATATASSCNTGTCADFNDLDFGNCGTQDVWISTSNPPSTVAGTDFIEWNWSTPQSFDEITIHHASSNAARQLTGATMQSWDGTQWVTTGTFSNLPPACSNTIGFQRVTTSRFRFTLFTMTGPGQTSNPNFREIEIFRASTSDDDAGVASTNTVPAVCPGSYPVEVLVQNFGTNAIDSVQVFWEINGVSQPSVNVVGTLDTIGGAGSADTLVNLGNFNFMAGVTYNLKAWTALPNGTADTANFNDTLNAQLMLGAPTGLAANNVTSSSADISWTSITGQSYGIIYGTTGFNPTTSGITVLPASLPANLANLTSTTVYDIYLFADCGGGVYSDTAGPVSFSTLITGPSGVNCTSGSPSVLISEEFDVQGGWTGDISNSSGDWQYNSGTTGSSNTGPSGAHSGSNYIYFEASGSGPASLISPRIDLTNAVDSAELSFWMHAYGQHIGYLVIRVSTTSATAGFNDTIFNYNQGELQTSSADPWQQIGVRLDQYIGQPIWLEFEADRTTSFSGDIALDLLQVRACGTFCLPEIFSLNSITPFADSAVFTVDTFSNNFMVEFGPCGFTQGTGTTQTVGSTFTAGSPNALLTPNTCYDLYVRRDCGANGTSAWGGPFQFRTACAPFSAPFVENFDDWRPGTGSTSQLNNDSIDPCFDRTPGTGSGTYMWLVDFNGTGSSGTGPTTDNSGSGNYLYTEASSGSTGSLARFSTPLIDVSSLTNPYFSFFVHAAGSDLDQLEVEYLDNGVWKNLMTLDVPPYQAGISDPFIEFGDTLSNLVSTITQIRFTATRGTSFGGDWAIDDLRLDEAPACQALSAANINITYLDGDSVFFTFDRSGSGVKWVVDYGLTGYTVGSGLGSFTVTDTFAGIGNLLSDTEYQFYIQDSCADGSLSFFVGPVTFATKCAAPSAAVLPLFDGFESYTNGPTFQGQGNLCNTGHNWSFEGSGPEGRMRLQAADFSSTLFAQTGSQAVTLDHSPSASVLSSNYLIMTVNLTNYTTSAGIELGFSYLSHGQDLGSNDKVWVRGAPSDTWVEIYDLRANAPSSGQYYTVSNLDIVGAITGAGQSIGAQTQIRFSQEGRFSAGSLTFSDGYTFDDVSLTAVTCPTPTGLSAENVLDSTATLSWNTGAGLSSEIWFGPAGFYQGTTTTGGVRSVVNADSLVVDTLSGNTCYEFLVRTICQAGDSSVFAGPFTFCTECSAFTAPYYNNFDVGQPTGEAPDCWEEVIIGGTSATLPAFEVYAFATPFTPPNHVRIYNYNADTLMGISPRFSDMDQGDKRVRFFTSSTNTANQLVVGTLSDKSAPSTFKPLDTITYAATNTYTEVTVELTAANGYNGTDEYVGILHGNTANFQTIYMDEFNYETLPTCFKPDSVLASNVTSTSAVVTWANNPNSTGNNFQISYGVSLNDPALGTMAMVTGNSFTLSGLAPASNYCVFVREICSALDTSVWTVKYCFATLCPPTFAAPYFTDFEVNSPGNAATYENCWTSGISTPRWEAEDATGANENSLNTGPFFDATFPSTVGGTYMYLETSGGALNAFSDLASPSIDISTLNNPELEYYYHMYGATINKLEVYAQDASSNLTLIDSIVGQQQMAGSDAFLSRKVSLAGLSFTDVNIVFRAYRGSSFTGDIAIDDVSIKESGSTFCPAPTNLTANVVSCDTVILSWSNGGDTSVVVYGDSTNLTAVNVFNDSSLVITGTLANTAYGAAVANICGSDTSAADTVVFDTDTIGAPTAAFTPTVNGLSVSFDANASTGNGNSYTWDFGDGNTSTAQNPTTVYATGGNYTVCLTVTNNCGTDSTCVSLAGISLAENALARSLSIFPNPTDGLVTVEFEPQGTAYATLKVTDARGRLLLEKEADLQANGTVGRTLDLSRFAKGVYMIEVTSGDMKAVRRVNVR